MADKPQWKKVSEGGSKATGGSGRKAASSSKGGAGRISRRQLRESKSPAKPSGKAQSGRDSASHKRTSPTRKRAGSGTRRRSDQRRRNSAQRNQQNRGKKWLKRIGLATLFTLLIFIFVGSILFVYLYAKTEVPGPDKFAIAQTARVFYSDGETEMGKLGERNREAVELQDLPEHVAHAVIASEDRSFYSNSGVDPKGILRALTNNIFGGARQGGSTLSQQYAENYYLGRTTGYADKLREAMLALKINRHQTKDEILINYLNTIYWGRGAYGIEAAAQAYFGHPAAELTLSESAMLAGIIPAPSNYDPAVDPDMAKTRFARVLDFMVEDGWIQPAEKEAAEFPETIEPQPTLEGFDGTSGYLLQHVKTELLNSAGMSEDQLYSGGINIVTTIDKKAQEAAVEAVQSLGERPEGNRVALTAINPKTGAVIAEYGGDDYSEIQSNAATQDIAVAGSIFKPFTLVAALQQGVELNEVFNGNSPREFQGAKVQNYANQSWGNVTLLNATAHSINTPYVELNERIGPAQTRLAAIQAGIPADTLGLEDNLTNTLGTASPHNIDVAAAYATFANEGKRHTPHIIKEVTDAAEDLLYRDNEDEDEAFPEDVVAKVNEALQAVMSYGTGEGASFDGRPMAGKSGSGQDNLGAWFIGYTPSLVTAVSMYQTGEDGAAQSITPFGGFEEITGSTLPKQVFVKFMEKVLSGTEVEQFPGTELPSPPPAPEPEETQEPDPAPEPDTQQDTNPPPPPPEPNQGGNSDDGNNGGNPPPPPPVNPPNQDESGDG